MRAQIETKLHERVARLLDDVVLPPAMWTTFAAGSVPLPIRYAVKFTRMGLKRGWPDILVVHHRAHGIELKRPGGRLSKTRTVKGRLVEGQESVFQKLQGAGMPIAVCHSEDEVMAALLRWQIPVRWYEPIEQENAA